MTTRITAKDQFGSTKGSVEVPDDARITKVVINPPTATINSTPAGSGGLLVQAEAKRGSWGVAVGGETAVLVGPEVTELTFLYENVTPPPPPPPPVVDLRFVAPRLAAAPTPPAGVAGAARLAWDFSLPVSAHPYPFNTRSGNQGGTQSYNLPSNVTYETTLGAMRLAARVANSNGYRYTSSYVNIGSSNASQRLPLEGYTEYCARSPFSFASWVCGWMDYRGSATDYVELDFGEQFTDQAPGCVRNQVHMPKFGGKNLVKTGATDGSVVELFASYKAFPIAKPVQPGKVRPNAQDVTVDDGTGAGAVAGHTGWHRYGVLRKKVAHGTGWRMQYTFFIDGIMVVRYTEPGRLNQAPAWYVPGDDAHSWDLRFDHWVGGESKATALDASGNPMFTYNGKQASGSTSYLRPVGEVPDAVLWQADPKNAYYYDIAWIRDMPLA